MYIIVSVNMCYFIFTYILYAISIQWILVNIDKTILHKDGGLHCDKASHEHLLSCFGLGLQVTVYEKDKYLIKSITSQILCPQV